MSEYDDLKAEVQTIIMEVMMVLYRHGITEVHMGAILRLMGVEEDQAQESDDDRIQLTDKFAKYMERMLDLVESDSNNKTLH